MEKKQTAVEWLNKWHIDNPYATHIEWAESLMKAKEMEKEQIEHAFDYGYNEGCSYMYGGISKPVISIQYYNKTYGKI